MSEYDGFGDVISTTTGVFGEEQAGLQPGYKKHRAVHGQPTQTGVVFQSECQVCGQPFLLEVEYPEMVSLKYGVNPVIAFRGRPNVLSNPTAWRFDPGQNGWGCNENVKCNNCYRHGVDIIIEPHEPEKILQAARRRGFINPAGEHEVSAICAQVAQSGQGVRR